MFPSPEFARAMQRLELFRFTRRQKRVKRNVRGTRRMPRGEKRRSGRAHVERRFLR